MNHSILISEKGVDNFQNKINEYNKKGYNSVGSVSTNMATYKDCTETLQIEFIQYTILMEKEDSDEKNSYFSV